MRFSLAGARHKLALVLDERAGRWGWPSPSVPSTHVIKPESGAYPDLVANEMFCMSVARRAGLPVVDAELKRIAGRPCLVSRRFDRRGAWPSAARIHQEDFCQALGYPPSGDVAAADERGPGFAESWGLLKAIGRLEDLPQLLNAAVCNYILGNGNAHGKNFALLFGEDGQRLGPSHSITSTVVYDAPIHAGMVLAEDYESEHAYLLELAQVSEECHCDLDEFRELAGRMSERIADSLEVVVERARGEGWHAPVIDEIVELAADRAFGLRAEVEY
jgi:serine/threonine-protein kinase HipA